EPVSEPPPDGTETEAPPDGSETDTPTDDPEIEAAARRAAQQARQEYWHEQRIAERADRVAAALGAGPAGNRAATALADAYLAAPEWSHGALVNATRLVLGSTPEWTDEVAASVLAYPRPPTD